MKLKEIIENLTNELSETTIKNIISEFENLENLKLLIKECSDNSNDFFIFLTQKHQIVVIHFFQVIFDHLDLFDDIKLYQACKNIADQALQQNHSNPWILLILGRYCERGYLENHLSLNELVERLPEALLGNTYSAKHYYLMATQIKPSSDNTTGIERANAYLADIYFCENNLVSAVACLKKAKSDPVLKAKYALMETIGIPSQLSLDVLKSINFYAEMMGIVLSNSLDNHNPTKIANFPILPQDITTVEAQFQKLKDIMHPEVQIYYAQFLEIQLMLSRGRNYTDEVTEREAELVYKILHIYYQMSQKKLPRAQSLLVKFIFDYVNLPMVENFIRKNSFKYQDFLLGPVSRGDLLAIALWARGIHLKEDLVMIDEFDKKQAKNFFAISIKLFQPQGLLDSSIYANKSNQENYQAYLTSDESKFNLHCVLLALQYFVPGAACFSAQLLNDLTPRNVIAPNIIFQIYYIGAMNNDITGHINGANLLRKNLLNLNPQQITLLFNFARKIYFSSNPVFANQAANILSQLRQYQELREEINKIFFNKQTYQAIKNNLKNNFSPIEELLKLLADNSKIKNGYKINHWLFEKNKIYIEFDEYLTSGEGGNCFFKIIGHSREEATKEMLKHKNNKDYQNWLAQEMFGIFISDKTRPDLLKYFKNNSEVINFINTLGKELSNTDNFEKNKEAFINFMSNSNYYSIYINSTYATTSWMAYERNPEPEKNTSLGGGAMHILSDIYSIAISIFQNKIEDNLLPIWVGQTYPKKIVKHIYMNHTEYKVNNSNLYSEEQNILCHFNELIPGDNQSIWPLISHNYNSVNELKTGNEEDDELLQAIQLSLQQDSSSKNQQNNDENPANFKMEMFPPSNIQTETNNSTNKPNTDEDAELKFALELSLGLSSNSRE